MSTVISGIFQSKVISNLDTYTHTALTAGPYNVSCSMTMRRPSALSIVIKQNGTTIASSSPPADQQTILSLQAVLVCSVNDVISIIVSSSSDVDQRINTIKGIIDIHTGTV
jgi:hypothetical protein